ncbi:dUTP diphosphatase [candidate division KSB1 bacterium]|nr:MAG: dUTP diphosphatase [candidate division KSB1 bacterium]
MKKTVVTVKRKDDCRDIPLPEYQTKGSSGMDLRAAVDEQVIIKPGTISLIPTGLYLAIPEGYEGQVRPRSGLALKHGIGVLNAPGTIDSDYRGEVCVILFNFGKDDFIIKRGERIAQLVITKFESVLLEEVDKLNSSRRSSGGFGSTGK